MVFWKQAQADQSHKRWKSSKEFLLDFEVKDFKFETDNLKLFFYYKKSLKVLESIKKARTLHDKKNCS